MINKKESIATIALLEQYRLSKQGVTSAEAGAKIMGKLAMVGDEEDLILASAILNQPVISEFEFRSLESKEVKCRKVLGLAKIYDKSDTYSSSLIADRLGKAEKLIAEAS